MNNRIRELAEQAGFDAVSMVAFDIGQDLEKFAELIVRECGNYMNTRIPGNIELSATVAKMKQHFGVEE